MSAFLLDSAGDVVFPLQLSSKARRVQQHIATRCRMIRGEWELNQEQGIPYIASDTVAEAYSILGQRNAVERARAEFRTMIAGTPGVAQVVSAEATFEGRKLSLSYRALLESGESVSGIVPISTGGTS